MEIFKYVNTVNEWAQYLSEQNLCDDTRFDIFKLLNRLSNVVISIHKHLTFFSFTTFVSVKTTKCTPDGSISVWSSPNPLPPFPIFQLWLGEKNFQFQIQDPPTTATHYYTPLAFPSVPTSGKIIIRWAMTFNFWRFFLTSIFQIYLICLN